MNWKHMIAFFGTIAAFYAVLYVGLTFFGYNPLLMLIG